MTTDLDRALSFRAAASEAGTLPAIITDDTTLTFSDLARASQCSAATKCIVGWSSVETIATILRALDDKRPLAILHPKATAEEQHRQRTLVGEAQLPAGTAFVLFTSGSTGAPRGVVLSRAAIYANAVASAAHLGWREHDRWALALPLAHAGGLSVVVRCLVARKPIVHGGALTDRLERATIASLVPSQLDYLVDHTIGPGNAVGVDEMWPVPVSLRAILLGGAAAPPLLLERASRFPYLRTYGLTESFGQLATTLPSHAGDRLAPLVPLPGVTLTAGTRESPARIVVRAPMLATSYLDGEPIAPEFVTADLGFLEAGNLHVVGRADDVIISGGENVHPLEIEAELAATPGVRAACVFGVPDVRWGQLVGVVLVVDDAFDREAAIARWSTMAEHRKPRELAIVDALPLSPNGKVDRRAASEIPRTTIHRR